MKNIAQGFLLFMTVIDLLLYMCLPDSDLKRFRNVSRLSLVLSSIIFLVALHYAGAFDNIFH